MTQNNEIQMEDMIEIKKEYQNDIQNDIQLSEEIETGDGIIDLNERASLHSNLHHNHYQDSKLIPEAESVELLNKRDNSNSLCLMITGLFCCCVWYANYFNYRYSNSHRARIFSKLSLIFALITTIVIFLLIGFLCVFIAFYIDYIIEMLSNVSKEYTLTKY